MRSTLFSRTSKWIGASALAILVGIGGGTAFLAASSPGALAQVQPAAQITVPAPVATASTPFSFADVVEKVSPAVVSIVVETETPSNDRRRGGREFNRNVPDFPDGDMQDFLDQFRDQFGPQGDRGQRGNRGPARKSGALGSGFAISADGYFVTNNHVVENATKVTVVFQNGDEMPATVVGTDQRTDLAVVKVDGVTDLAYVGLAEKDPRVGDWVLAIGNPFGLGGTVTAGIVSALDRDIGGTADQVPFMQIDAAVNTGNSGGPAFNLLGEVVGVNSAIYANGGGGNLGIAFAIPSTTVKQVTDQLIENGAVTRGYLGVGIQNVSRDIANSIGLESARGALVTEPTKDGPGAKAGIKSGDVITAVDGRDIGSARDLSLYIAGRGPGAEVEVKLWRDGKEETVKVTLAKFPEAAQSSEEEPAAVEPEQPAEPTPSSVGITLVPNEGGKGLLVQDVDPESIAAQKGFAVGDTVLEVNGKAVASSAEFEAAIKASTRDAALIKTQRGENVGYIGLPLDAAE